MITSRPSRLEQDQGRFLSGPDPGLTGHDHHHRSYGPPPPAPAPPLPSSPYQHQHQHSSSHPPSRIPPSPTHTINSPASSFPSYPCLDNFSTTARLGPVAEDDDDAEQVQVQAQVVVPVPGLHHHRHHRQRHPRNRLKDHPSSPSPSPQPPSSPSLRQPCPSSKRAPPSIPFSRTDTILDDLVLNPVASAPEPLKSWFARRKSEELELVQRRRFRPKMPPQQQQQSPKDPQQYWGYLISPDRPTQPTPLFRNLLLSIAGHIIDHLEPRDIRCLTPEKISGFYRLVGGDLDELFLGTPPEKLSSIYTTLGCNHTLQPVPDDDFVPPSIPALTPRGFAIWQTIQLLLDPEEHVPYLQEAVRRFQLADPETGEFFPRDIPKESFPSEPDEETVKWHDDMFAKKAVAENGATPVPGAMHGAMPGAMPGVMPGAMPGAMPGTMPGAMPGAMPGGMPGGIPSEEPGWDDYHHGNSHHYPSRSRRSKKKSSSRHRATTGGVADEGMMYARPQPVASPADPYGTHHHGHRAHTHHAEPFNSDTESHHHRGSRSHSQRRRDYPVSYVTQNGIITPVAVPMATLVPGAIHIQTEEPPSPTLPPPGTYRHTTTHYTTTSPPITTNASLDPNTASSCSSSYSDYPVHHHPHSATTPTHRSSSPLRPENHNLRKSHSAFYYTSHPPVPAPQSRSRSGGSSRRHSHVSDMGDSDSGGDDWVLKESGEVRRRRRREEEDHVRHRKAEMMLDLEMERDQSDLWGYERKSRSGGGSGNGGRYRDRSYTHGHGSSRLYF